MKVRLFVLSVFAVWTCKAQAIGPWKEVVNEVVLTEATTFRDIRLKNNKTEFEEIRMQILNSGAFIQRAEVVGDNLMSLPAWRVEGDYYFGIARYDTFPKTKVRSVRLYITTLKPGEPVRMLVHMR